MFWDSRPKEFPEPNVGVLALGFISGNFASLNLPADKWSPLNRCALAAASGLVLACAFPKTNVAGLAWIGPALMLAAAHGLRGMEAFRIGYVAGFMLQLILLRWLCQIPVTGFPILGWVLLSAFLALYPGTWVWLVSNFEFRTSNFWLVRTGWALLGAAAWVTMEMIQARFLSGFPWNFIGASQYAFTPLIQIAAFTGVYGVSFIVVWASLSLFNAVASLAAHPDRRFAWQKEIILPLFVVIVLFKLGMNRLPAGRDETGGTLRVTFVQPSIPQTVIWNAAESDRRFADLFSLTTQALTNSPDLLIWPEAAVPEKIRYTDDMRIAICRLAQSNRVWMIVGSDDAEPARHPRNADDVEYFNASFLISPDGDLAARYCKRNLVIFGEYIPLVCWLPFLTWFVPGSEGTVGFSPGEKPVTFELEQPDGRRREPKARENSGSSTVAPHQIVKTSTLICFEDTFPQLVREYVNDDTDFLVNLTNDGWFGESGEQWQHATTAVFRAVENGVPLLRCCNNGLTCWIDSRGAIREILRDARGSEYGAGVMTAEIPVLPPGRKRERTFYNQHGDWFGWSCATLTVIWLLMRPLKRNA